MRTLHRFFRTLEVLASHKQLCTQPDYMAVVYQIPMERTKFYNLRFTDYKKSTYAPFVIYADFKSLLKPINEKIKNTLNVQRH